MSSKSLYCQNFRVANDNDRDHILTIDCADNRLESIITANRVQKYGRDSTTPTRILKSIMISKSCNRPGRLSLASLLYLQIYVNQLPSRDKSLAQPAFGVPPATRHVMLPEEDGDPPVVETDLQVCDILSRVSDRTKRTNPIWSCIWFGNTKFAIFP